jgi:hypothetical protein
MRHIAGEAERDIDLYIHTTPSRNDEKRQGIRHSTLKAILPINTYRIDPDINVIFPTSETFNCGVHIDGRTL